MDDNEVPQAQGLRIYGSCVSRDSVPYLEREGFKLLSYTSRQSLISAVAPPREELGEASQGRLDSSFQQRALTSDLMGSLKDDLKRDPASNDVVLWDLVDERNGVLDLGDEVFITNSLELNRSGLVDDISGEKRLVKFGTDEHKELWRSALRHAVETGIIECSRVFLVQNAWAATSIEGDRFPFSESTLDPGLMNSHYVDYFRAAGEAGVRVIDIPVELCVTTRRHQWGIAPYHYHETFYSYLSRTFRVLVEQEMEDHDVA